MTLFKDEERARVIADLFSSYLDSEECYLSMLKTIATAALPGFRLVNATAELSGFGEMQLVIATAELKGFAKVAVFLLMMLLEKVPKNGITDVRKLFQDKLEVGVYIYPFTLSVVRMERVTYVRAFPFYVSTHWVSYCRCITV